MKLCYTVPLNRPERRHPHAWDPHFRPIIVFPRGVADSGGLADSRGVADSRRVAHPDRLATTGYTKMTILNSLRKRFSGRDAEVDVAEPTRSGDSQLPIPGYDRIGKKHILAELSKHSQVELAAIQTYEGSHEKRQPVFDKLRYLRGQEPLQDYDALSVKDVLAGLEGADTPTLQRTRVYERKFQNRPDVLDVIATALRERRPASVQRG